MNKNVYININNSVNNTETKYKRKPFEFCSEKRVRIANEISERFNFSHGGTKKNRKKNK